MYPILFSFWIEFQEKKRILFMLSFCHQKISKKKRIFWLEDYFYPFYFIFPSHIVTLCCLLLGKAPFYWIIYIWEFTSGNSQLRFILPLHSIIFITNIIWNLLVDLNMLIVRKAKKNRVYKENIKRKKGYIYI